MGQVQTNGRPIPVPDPYRRRWLNHRGIVFVFNNEDLNQVTCEQRVLRRPEVQCVAADSFAELRGIYVRHCLIERFHGPGSCRSRRATADRGRGRCLTAIPATMYPRRRRVTAALPRTWHAVAGWPVEGGPERPGGRKSFRAPIVAWASQPSQSLARTQRHHSWSFSPTMVHCQHAPPGGAGGRCRGRRTQAIIGVVDRHRLPDDLSLPLEREARPERAAAPEDQSPLPEEPFRQLDPSKTGIKQG